MSRRQLRFTLRMMMKVVGGVALGLGLIRWEQGPLLGFPAIVIGLVACLVRFGSMTKLRAAVCVVAVWPWLMFGFLYLTYGSAWLILGGRPGSVMPAPLGPWVHFWEGITALFLLLWPYCGLIGGLILISSDIYLTAEQNPPNRRLQIVWLLLGPTLLWAGAFVLLAIDPGHAFEWIID